ncbi:MAG: serine O-acetyltransferase EpsC [Zymomonas mobilis subsp. pomaceae]|uniref:serine O-acetyltransferase n=1 Tax=Zymomonas mobilis subsp. pomaceae (strain ATCC 29192 / DSM 22645 / JCM 10191 / CCUG 17912 / NBRC 13757 / NCIMB 11200 / NRRL B-4491 / Barker I) TaxID=579138 RepID=F8EV59_ZYMMT|nr:serine O-acetyltransferase EpsC [Zymomonas mobilis]AEI38277.1 serine O-acetyltransferase [Zymomonas mobilis subsp. pomaceae ATCC 29192]MDX5947966.1 serine O-acetyltransferase EpsC [Zymomonas mobilis subsp. pomaceae]GEB89295.1 serine O-acetyltransferase [Zymomonas mobilis subsp. pomaceae]
MLNSFISYLESIKMRDPAPRSRWEILLYPGVWALALHRLAHWLYQGELYFLARMINHISRFLTCIDIHPGAKIGRNFFVDHGFVVIGETACIGDNVTLYQCSTLGGTDPTNGVGGKRHPTLRNGVIVGSGAQILGPIEIGANARIGANAVVTRDVNENAVMVGIPARATNEEEVPDKKIDTKKAEFIPYGTPCGDQLDPNLHEIQLMHTEIALLQKKIENFIANQTKTSIPPIGPDKGLQPYSDPDMLSKGNDSAGSSA